MNPLLQRTRFAAAGLLLALAACGGGGGEADPGATPPPPLERNDPRRDWTFSVYSSSATTGITRGVVPGLDGSGTQVGGLLEKIAGFGETALLDDELFLLTEVIPPDGQANALVFSTGNGKTYGVFAEAPSGKLAGNNGAPDRIGGNASLLQRQSFIKRAADASLSFTLTDVLICAYDFNAVPPFGGDNDRTPVRGAVLLSIQAWTSQVATRRVFFSVAGGAALVGTRDRWTPFVQDFADGFSFVIWERIDFDVTLARYNTDGSLDAGFGVGGKVVSGAAGLAYTVAIQPDGRIVVAGEFDGALDLDFVLARYNADGSLDTGFGSGGRLTTDIGNTDNRATNIVLQSDGAIVVSGGVPKRITVGPTPDGHTDVVRYSASGSLDTSFGSGGKLALRGALVGEGLALQRDGKLVLVGSVNVGSGVTASTDFALMRLNSNGSPDATFGSAGTVTTAISTDRASALAVALQADGKIVVAGTTSNINANFAVARYNANGTLDTSFGNGFGVLTVDFFRFTDIAESVLLQPDGKIVVGGLARDDVDGYGLARLNP